MFIQSFYLLISHVNRFILHARIKGSATMNRLLMPQTDMGYATQAHSCFFNSFIDSIIQSFNHSLDQLAVTLKWAPSL